MYTSYAVKPDVSDETQANEDNVLEKGQYSVWQRGKSEFVLYGHEYVEYSCLQPAICTIGESKNRKIPAHIDCWHCSSRDMRLRVCYNLQESHSSRRCLEMSCHRDMTDL